MKEVTTFAAVAILGVGLILGQKPALAWYLDAEMTATNQEGSDNESGTAQTSEDLADTGINAMLLAATALTLLGLGVFGITLRKMPSYS